MIKVKKGKKQKTDNANMITVAVNLKEYFEKYENKNINKKHKDMRKGMTGMSFDAYASPVTRT